MSSSPSFREARQAMVDGLAERGISGRAQAALAAVPRELFVPWFFSYPPGVRLGSPADVREWRVDQASPDPDTVALVYDPERALGIARDINGRTTSTVSAPSLLGAMLDMLHLEAGMSVLEIGTGSGYTAALLAEAVGDPARVTTIDIDERLVVEARATLARSGYGAVRVIGADGDLGLPGERFDRIVVTVGCPDLSPSWANQLRPDGFALVPVQHGGVHPLMKVTAEGGGLSSVVIGRSAFVTARGRQASGRSPWPWAGRQGPRDDLRRRPLPDDITALLKPAPGREHLGAVGLWDFDYHLALLDRRASHLGTLRDGAGRTAAIDPHSAEVVWSHPGGEDVAVDLVDHVRDWLERGAPAASAYRSRWHEHSNAVAGTGADAGPQGAHSPAGSGRHGWAIERVHHRQVVTLTT